MWLLGNTGKTVVMAGFGLANVLCNVTGHSFLWGIGAGLDTLVSQAWGAKEYHAIGLYNQRVLVILTFVVNVPVVAIWLNATPILIALKQKRAVAEQVSLYASIRIPGLFMQSITCCLSKTLTAMGKTRWLLALNFVGIGVSLLLSWLLIAASSPISHYFEPIVGSAIMSSVVDALSALALLIVGMCDRDCQRCWPGWSRQCLRSWCSYFSLAVPAMLMAIFEWWSWDAVNFMAGLCPDPETALSANALLGNILMLLYCVPFGLQSGVQTLVGNALGAQSPQGSKMGAHTGCVLGLITMGLQGSLLYVFRDLWSRLFPEVPKVAAEVASLLRVVVFFVSGDGIQIVLSGVITGAGKQAVTTPILCVSYWLLGLPLGAVAAFIYPQNGLLGLWWGMTLAVWLHVLSYVAICFGFPCLPCAIDWPQAAHMAVKRLEAPAADAAAAGAPSCAEDAERLESDPTALSAVVDAGISQGSSINASVSMNNSRCGTSAEQQLLHAGRATREHTL